MIWGTISPQDNQPATIQFFLFRSLLSTTPSSPTKGKSCVLCLQGQLLLIQKEMYLFLKISYTKTMQKDESCLTLPSTTSSVTSGKSNDEWWQLWEQKHMLCLLQMGNFPQGFLLSLLLLLTKPSTRKLAWFYEKHKSSTNKQVFLPVLIILWFCDFKWW